MSNDLNEEISDTVSPYGHLKVDLSTFNLKEKSLISEVVSDQSIKGDILPKLSLQNNGELLTPQRQFLHLSQFLRQPDGSSNPDINPFVPEERTPGNGHSNSDQEEEIQLDQTFIPDDNNGDPNDKIKHSKKIK